MLQLARMGDLLQSSPLINSIREKSPCASITLLVSEETREVAESIPGVDEVIGFDFGRAHQIASEEGDGLLSKYHHLAGLLRDFRGRFFDHVYNLNYSSLNAGFMGLVRYRKAFCYGLDKTNRKTLKTSWMSYLFSMLRDRRLNRFNLVDIYLSGAGLTPSVSSPPYQVDDEARHATGRFLAQQGIGGQDRVIGFQLGAGDGIRCWPLESYIGLAPLLIRRQDVRILLFGSPSESHLGVELEGRLSQINGKAEGGKQIVNLVGKTTRQELAAFLKRCGLLVTPDTGTMHVATAVGTPVLALFLGSAFWHETGPYGNGHLIIHPRLACYPCLQSQQRCTDYPCKEAIVSKTVVQVIEWRWLGSQNGFLDAPRLPSDPDVAILRSKMADGFVQYVPVSETPLTLEDILGQGYRAMWQRVLNDRWSSKPFQVEAILTNDDISSLLEEHSRQFKDLERHFERLERLFIAGQGSFYPEETGQRECPLGRDQVLHILRGKRGAGPRWVKPLIHFFTVEYENILSGNGDHDREIQKLFARLARGAGFMKGFSKTLARTLLS